MCVWQSKTAPFGWVGDRWAKRLLSSRRNDVPVVLDGVVGAAGEEPGDGRPPVAVKAVQGQQPRFFLLRERAAVDLRVQLIEPSQPTALAYTCKTNKLTYIAKDSWKKLNHIDPSQNNSTRSSWNVFCDGVPVVRAESSDQVLELFVLLWPPVAPAHAHALLVDRPRTLGNR